MKLTERYIFKIAIVAFIACLTALTGVIWITSALRQLDLLTSKGQTILVFLYATILTLPGLIVFIAPFTLLIAALYTLNRLNSDSELIVMSASGIKPASLLRPFLLLGLIISVLVGLLALYLNPLALQNARSLTNKIRADFISFFVKEGQFANLEGLTIHYREKAGDILKGMVIQDRRDPNSVMTYLAERSFTRDVGERSFLVLENGSVQRQTPSGHDVSIVMFERYSIDLSTLQAQTDLGMKPSERTTWQLLFPNPDDPFYQRFSGRFVSELHERLSSVLYPIVMVLVAFACLGSARTTRQGRGMAISMAILWAVLVRFAGHAAKNAVMSNQSLVWLVYSASIISILVALVFIFQEARVQRYRARLNAIFGNFLFWRWLSPAQSKGA